MKKKTIKQIQALKYLIIKSKDINDTAKQIAILLIDASERLTKSVCLTLNEDDGDYGAQNIQKTARNIDGIRSSNGRMHIDAIFTLMKSTFSFSIHYGDFDPKREGSPFNNDGQFPGYPPDKVAGSPGLVKKGLPMRYTFWLASRDYAEDAELVPVSKEILEEVNIKASGLYPTLGDD